MTAADVKLRSNLPVGSSPWATRRAQWRALGLTDEQMQRPKIAIVNSSSELAICFAHLDGIVPRLKESIAAAGGIAFEVRTVAPSDFITSAGREGRYVLPSRELIASDIEVAVEGAQLDGMVCLASCDKTAPGQLLAAARLNLPTIVIPCGYQTSGRYCDAHIDIEDVFLNAGRTAAGELSVEELSGMADQAITSPGVCQGMGTANSMHMTAEALGMALPGSSPVRANSPRMWQAVEDAGRRIVEMVHADLRPREILTPAAFRNAVTVMLSASGSINTVKHLQALAVEAACEVDVWAEFERLGPSVPQLIAVRPNGETTIDAFEHAGGTAALMSQLAPLLDLDTPTVTGPLRETLAQAEVHDAAVIRPIADPLGNEPTILIVRGSLAPAGAIVKRAVADTRPKYFRGEAIIFHSRQEALAGLHAGKIRPGQVVVLSGVGPKGGPGMTFVSGFIFALEGAGFGETVAVVTDGQLSGLVNKGTVVGEVAPEAAIGGPLALVQPGDQISIDLEARTVDLDVPALELAGRRPWMAHGQEELEHSWLGIYAGAVGPSQTGLTLSGPAGADLAEPQR